MAINPINDISSIYMKEVFEPQLGKKGAAPAAGGAKKVEKGKEDSESSAKRIRQAVYDIRYRARREDVKLDQAFNQYMSHTTMTGPEKTAVKEKLGLISGPVSEETEQKKYKVRVTDKSSGKSYVRYATREKINSLRANPNIRSVEMTSYGSPYEGERTKGDRTAAAKAGKDYDGDGKVESGAKEYRGVIHNAIQKKKGKTPDGKDTSNVKEGFSNWRNDLCEVIDRIDRIESNPKMVTGKSGKKSKIVINPTLPEAIQNLGGELIEMVEIDEKTLTTPETKKKEEIVKSMKKNLAGFKSRYGKRAKEVMYATATKQAKEVAEQATNPTISQTQQKPQNTSAVSAVLQAKQKADSAEKDLAMKQKMAAQKGVNLASLSSSYEMEGEVIDERRKEDKVAETPRKPRNPAFEYIAKKMGTSRMGVKPRGEKKVPGQKPPVAGAYGGPKSPEQKVAIRRATAQRAQDMYKPRAGESD